MIKGNRMFWLIATGPMPYPESVSFGSIVAVIRNQSSPTILLYPRGESLHNDTSLRTHFHVVSGFFWLVQSSKTRTPVLADKHKAGIPHTWCLGAVALLGHSCILGYLASFCYHSFSISIFWVLDFSHLFNNLQSNGNFSTRSVCIRWNFLTVVLKVNRPSAVHTFPVWDFVALFNLQYLIL